MKFKKHILLFVLVPFLIMSIGASFVRFIVLKDYFVAYEGTCDPYIQNCFVGCNDENCTDTYYYSKIQKYAPDIMQQCGIDITDCENANKCLPEELNSCTITYCSSTTDEETCETLSTTDAIEQNNNQQAI